MYIEARILYLLSHMRIIYIGTNYRVYIILYSMYNVHNAYYSIGVNKLEFKQDTEHPTYLPKQLKVCTHRYIMYVTPQTQEFYSNI